MARRHRGRRAGDGRQEGSGEAAAPTSKTIALSLEEVVSLLERADIVGHELVPEGTNYTFAVVMSADGTGPFLGIYKPREGERPLWDFPDGTLHLRERAAYLTSLHLGWPNIPPTVIREGPYGVGMVQLYISTDGQPDFLGFRQHRRRELMEIALFDLLTNNADRKGGHCLLGSDGRLWAIDHGLTFNVAPKLRTILWDFCGQPIPQSLLEDLESLRDDAGRCQTLRSALEPCLQPAEIEVFFQRLERVLRTRKYPQLNPHRNVPWPPV